MGGEYSKCCGRVATNKNNITRRHILFTIYIHITINLITIYMFRSIPQSHQETYVLDPQPTCFWLQHSF